MHFIGMAGYYRRFCLNFATVVEPLTQLLSKKVKFLWSNRCDKAYEKLKVKLLSAPVLKIPDFNSHFKLPVDASDVGAVHKHTWNMLKLCHLFVRFCLTPNGILFS